MARASVVLCTRDRRESLLLCLESLLLSAAACPQPTEGVVVDDGSLDGTTEAANRFASLHPEWPITVVQAHGRGLAGARNVGVVAARGEILTFVDDDCRVTPGYFAEMLCAFAADAEMVLRGGRVLLGDCRDAPLTIKDSVETERLSPRGDLGGFILGCNMAMPRALLDRIGWFDERFGAGTSLRSGEDTDLVIRTLLAGIPVEYLGGATVLHFHGRRTRDAVLKIHRHYNIGNGALMVKHLLRAPWFMRSGYWSVRNALGEVVGGPKFDHGLQFSHGPMVLDFMHGGLLFLKIRFQEALCRLLPVRRSVGPIYPRQSVSEPESGGLSLP